MSSWRECVLGRFVRLKTNWSNWSIHIASDVVWTDILGKKAKQKPQRWTFGRVYCGSCWAKVTFAGHPIECCTSQLVAVRFIFTFRASHVLSPVATKNLATYKDSEIVKHTLSLFLILCRGQHLPNSRNLSQWINGRGWQHHRIGIAISQGFQGFDVLVLQIHIAVMG